MAILSVTVGSIPFIVSAPPAVIAGAAVVVGVTTVRAVCDVARGVYSVGNWAFSAMRSTESKKSAETLEKEFVRLEMDELKDSKAIILARKMNKVKPE